MIPEVGNRYGSLAPRAPISIPEPISIPVSASGPLWTVACSGLDKHAHAALCTTPAPPATSAVLRSRFSTPTCPCVHHGPSLREDGAPSFVVCKRPGGTLVSIVEDCLGALLLRPLAVRRVDRELSEDRRLCVVLRFNTLLLGRDWDGIERKDGSVWYVLGRKRGQCRLMVARCFASLPRFAHLRCLSGTR